MDLDLSAIHACAMRRWSPQIGDPTVAGWVTVAAYGLCALLALRVFSRSTMRAERRFWLLLFLVMAFLCVNKQLDLQSLLTAVGRCISQQQGWYDDRRLYQREFIEVLLGVILACLGLGLWLMGRHLRRNGLALAGLALVAGFVAVRAVGFHHFDVFINTRSLGLRSNVILELSGLVLIGLNAVLLLASSPRRGPDLARPGRG